MLVLFGILVIIASVVLGLIVLIQNPKGGGLSSSFGGFGNQIMGVKQTTDVLEKGTWLFAAIVGVLCVLSPAFIPKTAGSSSKNEELLKGVSAPAQKSTANPATTAPMPKTDTGK
ncbi:MAG TPA: preprotein translocase subunit SecG [Ferruginibacter sp.]|nr:preprotein translocase subunit SecG [Ferruginibacter sp.]